MQARLLLSILIGAVAGFGFYCKNTAIGGLTASKVRTLPGSNGSRVQEA
jgi:hypothetical protein